MNAAVKEQNMQWWYSSWWGFLFIRPVMFERAASVSLSLSITLSVWLSRSLSGHILNIPTGLEAISTTVPRVPQPT